MFYFRNILGNTSLINQLRKTVKNNTISHSYLILGNDGVGRKTIVNTFVQYLLCTNRDEINQEPCGECKSCNTFVSNNHPDVIYVGQEKGIKTIGVGEIRDDILESLSYSPYQSHKKIYIIEQGNLLTLEAQNALLKTLEEPPEYAIFFIIGNKRESFLQTILSRVIEISIPPLSEKLVNKYMVEYIENLSVEKRLDPDFITAYADGSIGQGIFLIEDEEFFSMRENVIKDLCELPYMELGKALLLAKKWTNSYKNENKFFNVLEIWYRDLVVVNQLKNGDFLIQKDKEEEIFKIAFSDTEENFSEKYKAVLNAKKNIVLNSNFRLTLEVMLMNLKEK